MTETIAILALLICLCVVFLRVRRPDYALSITPLFLVPLGHMIGVALVYGAKMPFFSFAPEFVVAFIDIAAIAISGPAILFLSMKIKNKKVKRFYIVLLCSYNSILGCVYVYRTLMPIL